MTACPRCGARWLVEPGHAGRNVSCPACGVESAVPMRAAAAPTSPPAAVATAAPLPVAAGPPPAMPRVPDPVVPEARGTAAMVLVLGISALLPGLGCITGPAAWVLGALARADARRDGRRPEPALTAGWVLGIVSTVLGSLLVALWIIMAAFVT